MALPFFFEENVNNQSTFVLNEDTSRHIAQVLRMQKGDDVKITDGKGQVLTCQIINQNKKATQVKMVAAEIQEPPAKRIAIAISLIKNNSRFEWFLEKSTEIGISEIIPMLCERTEKQHFRYDRMRNILISAMLQSQQAWLPHLHPASPFKQVAGLKNYTQKFVAYCDDGAKESLVNQIDNSEGPAIILIGPEGDFTKNEIDTAHQNNFVSTSLGSTRLRTETAGIVAAVILNFLDKRKIT